MYTILIQLTNSEDSTVALNAERREEIKQIKANGISWFDGIDINSPIYASSFIRPNANNKACDMQSLFAHNGAVLHHGEYSYARAIYTGAHDPIIVTHVTLGDYVTTASNHMMGKGHPGRDKSYWDKASFIVEMEKLHGPVFSFSQTVYVDYKTPLTVVHNEYGNVELSPIQFFRPKSLFEDIIDRFTVDKVYDQASFERKARQVHDGLYSYERAVYTTTHEKLLIRHPKYGYHLISAASHLKGYGHPCIDKQWTYIYLVMFKCLNTGKAVYKIGQTTDDSGFRKNKTKGCEHVNISTFKIPTFNSNEIETEVLTKMRKKFGQVSDAIKELISDGSTELFRFNEAAKSYFLELAEDYSEQYPPKEDRLDLTV